MFSSGKQRIRPYVLFSSHRPLLFQRNSSNRQRVLNRIRDKIVQDHDYMVNNEEGVRLKIDPKQIKTFEVSIYRIISPFQ